MPRREIRRMKKDKKQEGEKPKRTIYFYFTLVVFVIVAISFIGVPVVSSWQGSARIVFGSYNGKEISYIRLENSYFYKKRWNDVIVSYNNELARYYESFGLQFDPESYYNNMSPENKERVNYRFWQQAFMLVVEHEAILMEAERSGLWISEKRVSDTLLEYGPYIKRDELTGEYYFSEEEYNNTTRTERNDIRDLRREELIDSQYKSDVIYNHMNYTNLNEILFAQLMFQKERSFQFVSFDFNTYPQDLVYQFGIENSNKFKKVELSRITVTSSKENAEEIRNKVLNGENSFDELALNYSEDTDKDDGGKMGEKYYYDLLMILGNEDSVDRLFELQKDEYSSIYEIVIEARKSWVFFKIDSEVVEPDFESEETLEDVKSYILTNELYIVENYFREKADEFKAIADEEDFLNACIAFTFFPMTTQYFPINYLNIIESKPIKVVGGQGNELTGAESNEDFFIAAFRLKENEVSEPIKIRNKYVILSLVDERDLPEEDQYGIINSINSLKFQAIQQDVQEILVDENKLIDNFDEVYLKEIAIY